MVTTEGPVEELRVDGIRNLREVEIQGAAVNWLYGPNGAGKTSVLEALHLTAFGRSFRGGGRLDWLSTATRQAQVFCRIAGHRLGWSQEGREYRARIDGGDAHQRSDIARYLACLTFHPQSHDVIQGPPEHRRRLLDYAVFHVEPGFMSIWRNYRRAQQQRNAGLRAGVRDADLEPWEAALGAAAGKLSQLRGKVAEDLTTRLQEQEALGDLTIRLQPGYDVESELATILAENRQRDRELGYTRDGPHRADLAIRDKHGVVAGRLSRGQQKLLALRLLLAVGVIIAEAGHSQPIFCLDDLHSELDEAARARVLDMLGGQDWQLWITALEKPDSAVRASCRLFHVEHGSVTAL